MGGLIATISTTILSFVTAGTRPTVSHSRVTPRSRLRWSDPRSDDNYDKHALDLTHKHTIAAPSLWDMLEPGFSVIKGTHVYRRGGGGRQATLA